MTREVCIGPNERKLYSQLDDALKHSGDEDVRFTTVNCVRAGAINAYLWTRRYKTSREVKFDTDEESFETRPIYIISGVKKE